MVKRVDIDLKFIPLNLMIQWYEGRVPFTSGDHPPGPFLRAANNRQLLFNFPATVTATEEDVSAAAENVENENPLEVQNILEPIHLEGNTVNGRWKCPYCPYEPKQKHKVTRHIQIRHLGIRNYKCDECSELFQTQQNLDNHKRTHTGEKPFACPQCDFSSANKGNVTKHIKNIHGGN